MGKIRYTGAYSRDVTAEGEATPWVQPADVEVAVPWGYARKAWTAQKYADDDYTFAQLANVDPSLADRNTDTRTWVSRDGWDGWFAPNDPESGIARSAMAMDQIRMYAAWADGAWSTTIIQDTRAYRISLRPSSVPEPAAPTPPAGFEVEYSGGQYVDFSVEVRWSTAQGSGSFVTEGTPYSQALLIEPNMPFYSKPDALDHWPTPATVSAWNEESRISATVEDFANYAQDAHYATATFSTNSDFDLTVISDWYSDNAPPPFPTVPPVGIDEGQFSTYAQIEGIEITGTYRPRRYRYVVKEGDPTFVATEHGGGIIGLYEKREDSVRVTMHNAESPATPVASAVVPTVNPYYQPTYSLYLGGGRSVIISSSVGGTSSDAELRTITYRGGVLSVGAMTLFGSARSNGEPFQRFFAFAVDGSRFRIVGELSSGGAAVGDYVVDPQGRIAFEGPWRTVSVDLRGPAGSQGSWSVVRGGKVFVLGDRIRRYDWETFALEATSDFTAPPSVQTSYGRQDGFGHAVLGPDGRLKVFAITPYASPAIPQLPIQHVDLWSISLTTLQRTVRRLKPPQASAAGGVTVPGWPSIWNISWPPSGNSNSSRGALGDQRSHMGTILAVYGLAHINAPERGSSAGVLSSANESVGVVTREVGEGGTGAPEAIFYTRDNYAVTLDSRGLYGTNSTFWATGPVLPPDDTLRPLSSFKQGFYS